jgi:hypothetical protein
MPHGKAGGLSNGDLSPREDEFDAWLNGAPHFAFALAQEYPHEQMRIVQEGFKKQDLLEAA